MKKSGGLDLALLTSDTPASAAAVFTTNLVQAAPVALSREHVRRAAARVRGIVVNSGNANCSTAAAGRAAALATAKVTARELGCRPEQVLVCSTGVIGVPLRVERILRALPALAAARKRTHKAFASVTHAIMTTDTQPKWAAAECRIGGRTVRLAGCAKGAGMIHPNMATMLAFVLTDAAVVPTVLRRTLREVAGRTFNCISVDGDTSTNDTVIVLANGAAGGKILSRPGTENYRRFAEALEKICISLALQIVADGEGATRVVEIEVCGAADAGAAKKIAETIATSPLVKTALAGADPNWGRILAAAGRAGVPFEPERVEIRLAGVRVYSRGQALPFNERAVSHRMRASFVPILMDLHQSPARSESAGRRVTTHQSRFWTCDFTGDYVDINSSYRT